MATDVDRVPAGAPTRPAPRASRYNGKWADRLRSSPRSSSSSLYQYILPQPERQRCNDFFTDWLPLTSPSTSAWSG